MPIYKMKGSKDGLQKYRIRINYHDMSGNARQIDRVAYGLDNAKELEMRLNRDIKKEAPARRLTLQPGFFASHHINTSGPRSVLLGPDAFRCGLYRSECACPS